MPDAEADQGRQRRRERRDVDRVREQAGEAQAAPEREHRGEERQQRRPQRAEGDREHDRGGDEADELARAAARLLRRLLDAAAAELDLQPVAARVLRGRDQLVVGRLRDVGDRLLAVHVDVGERDRPVLGDLLRGRALGERAVDALDVRAVGDLLERLLDPRAGRRTGTSSAANTTWFVSVDSVLKLSVQQGQRRRRLRARQRERVRVAGAGAGAEAAERRQGDDPDRRGRRTCG